MDVHDAADDRDDEDDPFRCGEHLLVLLPPRPEVWNQYELMTKSWTTMWLNHRAADGTLFRFSVASIGKSNSLFHRLRTPTLSLTLHTTGYHLQAREHTRGRLGLAGRLPARHAERCRGTFAGAGLASQPGEG